MRFDYWVIRYVPDAVRGEFVNIGVIAGRGDDWSVRRVANLRRASRIGGSASATAAFLHDVERAVEAPIQTVHAVIPGGRRVISSGELEDLRVRMNNVVQLAAPRPVLAASSREAADLAFELMVVDSDRDVQQRSRTKAMRRLRSAFDHDPALSQHVELARRMAVGTQEARIDFALRLGTVRQLSQVWAFDGKDTSYLQTQIQAWNYLLGLLRSEGGELRAKGRGDVLAAIPPDVEVNAVYTPPSTDDGRIQLDIAADGWRRLDVSPVPADESHTVVAEAERLLAS